MERETTDNEADHSAIPVVGGDDYWMKVNAPLTKTQAGLLAGGLITVGAALGTAGSIFFGNRSPKDKVRITSSAAAFAFKALMAGTGKFVFAKTKLNSKFSWICCRNSKICSA